MNQLKKTKYTIEVESLIDIEIKLDSFKVLMSHKETREQDLFKAYTSMKEERTEEERKKLRDAIELNHKAFLKAIEFIGIKHEIIED